MCDHVWIFHAHKNGVVMQLSCGPPTPTPGARRAHRPSDCQRKVDVNVEPLRLEGAKWLVMVWNFSRTAWRWSKLFLRPKSFEMVVWTPLRARDAEWELGTLATSRATYRDCYGGGNALVRAATFAFCTFMNSR
jgi:hypothetical protein